MSESDLLSAPPELASYAEYAELAPAINESLTVTVPTNHRSVRRLLGGLIALALGAILAALTLVLLDDGSNAVRASASVAALALIYLGADRIGRYIFGQQFDLALLLSIGWLAIIALSAITADWLPLSESRDVSKTLLTPTLETPQVFSSHPLGTDRQGLDILGGIVYGARVSLVVSFGAVIIGTIIGGVVGLFAGYFQGRTQSVVGLFTDALLAFPPLILLLGMVAVLKPNVSNVTLALGFLSIPIYIRLARANAMVFAQREFVLAARALGATKRRVLFREVLPNLLLPIMSYGFIVVGALIVAEASLSFLGLSVARPTPTWGDMIAAGQGDLEDHPHLVFIPGAVLFLTVFALNRVGDKARNLWDPRQARV